jgi:hypothetical protein
MLVIVLLGCLASLAPAGSAPTDSTERLLRRAAYDFSYFGKDLGDESFTITRTADGYRIEARLALGVDGQVPSESTYELDEERRLRRATYRELVPNGAEAEYEISGGVLVARGLGGSASGEHRIELEPGAVVTGPHYVTDFFVLHPLALPIGDRHEQAAYTFGFKGWKPTRVTLKSKREGNRTVKDGRGARIGASVYRCEIIGPKQTFKTRSYLDPDGVSVKIKVSAAIGSMKVTLQ